MGFYGGRPDTLARMQRTLRTNYPLLRISYVHSPPFWSLSQEELASDLDEINASGAKLVFVGLGSPKQEIWMAQNYASLNCVCLGVGAVFEFLSGEKVLPPGWIQRMGLTWFVRLCQEPRRLAIRNLYSPIFVLMVLTQFSFNICRRVMRLSPR